MPTTTLEFGPATVISGPNGSGKTQLLKLLTSMQAEGFSAWTARGGIECELQWFDPNLQTMRIIVPNDRTPLFRIDGRDFGIRPSAPTTITLSKIETMRDPVATAINSLGLGGKDLQRLVPLLGRRSGTGFAGSAVDRVELDEHNELSAYGEKTWKQGLPFGSLSGGEQAALLVELAIIRAQHIHGTGPILLAIDPWPTITQQFGPKLGVLLTELTSSVQVFVTSSTELNFDTTGWAKSVLSIRWR